MTDLASFTATTQKVDVVHPVTKEPIGLTINLRPKTSPEVRDIDRRITNDLLRHRGKSLTADKVEANRLDLLVAATEGWAWDDEATWHGEKPDATPINVRKVYKEAPWIKEQVDDALGDDAAFFRGTD